MADIKGVFNDRFAGVAETLSASLDSGDDVGASVAVFLDGEPVVDIWGGWCNEARTRAWERDTIVNVFSSTKLMTALTALVLADRGELDLYAPVARYWPEFARHGKDKVEVRHLLSHSAGLHTWTEPLTFEELWQWDPAAQRLADQAPEWEPGTAAGYHGITQGTLVGEVVRRVTGLSIGTYFAREIAGPLHADFHIGLPAAEHHRVSHVIPPVTKWSGRGDDSAVAKSLSNPPMHLFTEAIANTPGWRMAEIPAAGGHGNARSMATIQSVLANGGESGGVRLLSEAGCRKAFEPQTDGYDVILELPITWGMGYALNTAALPISPNPNAGFWGGSGGSACLVDMDARLCVAYAMNNMINDAIGVDPRPAAIIAAVYTALAG